MTGSLRKRGESWELRVYGGTDPTTGRRKWVTATTKGTRRAATQALRDLAARVDYPRRMTSGVTFGRLLVDWLEAASPGWAPTTVRQNRHIVEAYLIPGLGETPLARLTTEEIDAFYGRLLSEGGRAGKPLSSSTVHRIHVVLHRALQQALRWDWVWVNPAAQATPPPMVYVPRSPPSPEEVQSLLDHVAARDLDLYAYLSLAVSTGARRSQLLALQWGDVDFHRGQLAFLRAVVDAPGGPTLCLTKTGQTYRIHLDDKTLRILECHQRRAPYRAADAGSCVQRTGFVFSDDPDGTSPWKPNRVTKRFIGVRNALGLTCRLHDLRHFMATTMLAAGVPITTVSARLSHARASTTLNVYAHAVPGADREAAQLLAGVLNGARGHLQSDGKRSRLLDSDSAGSWRPVARARSRRS